MSVKEIETLIPKDHRESSYSTQILCWIVNENKKGRYDHMSIITFTINLYCNLTCLVKQHLDYYNSQILVNLYFVFTMTSFSTNVANDGNKLHIL